jgi:hypothetical protein
VGTYPQEYDFVELYHQLDPMRPLTGGGADSALYVDWQRELARSYDVKTLLANGIARGGSRPITHLFTGTRGAGKTTELHRIKTILENGIKVPGRDRPKQFFVSVLVADKWLDLAELRAEDLSFQIVRQLITDLTDAHYKPTGRVRDFFRRLADDLKKIGIDAIEVGSQSIKITLKIQEITNKTTRQKFRELLQGNLPTIYDIINNELLTSARKYLRETLDIDEVLVIVDDLDRIPLESGHDQLFVHHPGQLRALNCPILYTVPIDLAHSSRQNVIGDTFGTQIVTLPIMPFLDRDGKVNERAASNLREIVRRRVEAAGITLDALFETEELLTETLAASGGHVRTLFVLLLSMLHRMETLPIVGSVVDDSLHFNAATLALPLTSEKWRILDEVHRTKRQVNDNREAWNELLREFYVLTYLDKGGYWFDWNPQLRYTDSGR